MQKYLEAAKSRCIYVKKKYISNSAWRLYGAGVRFSSFTIRRTTFQGFRLVSAITLCPKTDTPKLPEYFIMLNILNNSETKNSMGLRSQNNCSPQEVT